MSKGTDALKASVSVGLDQAAVCLTSDCVQETQERGCCRLLRGCQSCAAESHLVEHIARPLPISGLV